MLYLKWFAISIFTFFAVALIFMLGYDFLLCPPFLCVGPRYELGQAGGDGDIWPEIVAVVSSLAALFSSIATFYLGIREDRRKQEEHEAKMKIANAGIEED